MSFSLTVIFPRSSETSTWPAAISFCSEVLSCSYCALFAWSSPFSASSFFEAVASSSSCCCWEVLCCCRSAVCFSRAVLLALSSSYFCLFCCASRCAAANSSFETPHPAATTMQTIGSILLIMASSGPRPLYSRIGPGAH